MAKDYGLKISQEGHDVKIANDNQLVLSSAFPTLKSFLSGYVQATGDWNNDANLEVVHNLGYVPKWIGYSKSGRTNYYRWVHGIGDVVDDGTGQIYIMADSTKLYIRIVFFDGDSETVRVYYDIFDSRINT